MAKIYIGIDTSNYTTSAAVITDAEAVINVKKILSVNSGQKGLRQSEALFMHTNELPEIIEGLVKKAREAFGYVEISAIGVSDKPRNVPGSYMPCFLAGVSAARAAAAVLDVPLYRFSHQEGHIEAALLGARLSGTHFPEAKDFFAFHMSGGTCELLKVKALKAGYHTEIISKTLDITAGQLIDRCGVYLGLPFPSGSFLEKLASESKKDYNNIRINYTSDGINLSGFENRFYKMIQDKNDKSDAAKMIFDAVFAVIDTMLEKTGVKSSGLPVLFSGGVMSSRLLKSRLSENRNYYFSTPEYSADNAAGIAALARKACGLA